MAGKDRSVFAGPPVPPQNAQHTPGCGQRQEEQLVKSDAVGAKASLTEAGTTGTLLGSAKRNRARRQGLATDHEAL